MEGNDGGVGVHADCTLPWPPVHDLHRGQQELGDDLLIRHQPDPHVLQFFACISANALRPYRLKVHEPEVQAYRSHEWVSCEPYVRSQSPDEREPLPIHLDHYRPYHLPIWVLTQSHGEPPGRGERSEIQIYAELHVECRDHSHHNRLWRHIPQNRTWQDSRLPPDDLGYFLGLLLCGNCQQHVDLHILRREILYPTTTAPFQRRIKDLCS